MLNNPNVCAIVVTYNRKKLLLECLSGLSKCDTDSLKCIIIVDNDSKDGTRSYFEENNNVFAVVDHSTLVENGYHDFTKKYQSKDQDVLIRTKLVYYNLNRNFGGAGGFHYGMRLAREIGFDWYWLMDDDVEPHPGCLRNLLAKSTVSSCIHPVKKYINGDTYQWEGFFNPKKGNTIYLGNFGLKHKDLTFVNYGNFEGMLISDDVVHKIGLPDKRFFICGDDLIYGWLASNYTNVALVKDAVIERKKDPLSDKNVSNFTLFYLLRNGHLIIEHLDKHFGKEFYLRRRWFFHLQYIKWFFYTCGYIFKLDFKFAAARIRVIGLSYSSFLRKRNGLYDF